MKILFCKEASTSRDRRRTGSAGRGGPAVRELCVGIRQLGPFVSLLVPVPSPWDSPWHAVAARIFECMDGQFLNKLDRLFVGPCLLVSWSRRGQPRHCATDREGVSQPWRRGGAASRCEGSHDVGGERRGAGENDIGKALMVWRGLPSGGGWRKLGALAHMPFKHPSSHR